MTFHKRQKGFIALTSALIISSVMLLIATGGSLAGFYTRMTALNDEYKERSSALAESCVNHTLITLAGTPTYTGVATTTVSGIQNGQCFTGAVSKSGVAPNDTYQFKTRAIYGNAYTLISVVAKTSDLSITSYTEIPMF